MDFETVVPILISICTVAGAGACVAVFVEFFATMFENN